MSSALWRHGSRNANRRCADKLSVMKFWISALCALTLFAQTDNAPVKLNIEREPTFGPAGAPVTLVEFGDLECPSCRAEAPVLRQLIPQLYPNKVRVVFKDYPLESIHPWARAASIAARCIYRQDAQAFWKFYD